MNVITTKLLKLITKEQKFLLIRKFVKKYYKKSKSESESETKSKFPMTFTFILSKKALRNGSDKYQCKNNDSFILYIPQNISRTPTKIKRSINIKINKSKFYKSNEFTIAKKASRSGADKYEFIDDDKFVVYLPQFITRLTSEPFEKIYLSFQEESNDE